MKEALASSRSKPNDRNGGEEWTKRGEPIYNVAAEVIQTLGDHGMLISSTGSKCDVEPYANVDLALVIALQNAGPLIFSPDGGVYWENSGPETLDRKLWTGRKSCGGGSGCCIGISGLGGLCCGLACREFAREIVSVEL